MSETDDKKKKKKKSKKKDGSESEAEGGGFDQPPSTPPPAEPEDVLILKRLEDVSLRSHKYAHEIERLRAEGKKKDHDTTKMIKFLEDEVKRKDKANKSLMKQLREMGELHAVEVKTLKKQFEGAMKRAEQVFMGKEEELLEKNRHIMQEVSDLGNFRKLRHDLAAELELTKQTIHSNEKRHKAQLDELETKFQQARQQLQDEAAQRIAHSRAVYKEEVGRELKLESQAVKTENIQLAKELKFHQEVADRLQKENHKLQDTVKRLKRDMSLTNQKEEEWAKRGLRQSQQIKELTEKVKMLEQSLTQVLRDVELEREARDQKQRQEMEALRQELDSQKAAHNIKSRDLANLRRHATALLRQRSELEQFFHDALSQVKEEIKQRRMAEYKRAKLLHQRSIRQLALPRGAAAPAIPESVPPDPAAPSDRVELSDLATDDRERVLKLLFARLNGTPLAGELRLPPHAFDAHVTPALPPAQTQGQIRPGSEPRLEGGGARGGMTFLTDM